MGDSKGRVVPLWNGLEETTPLRRPKSAQPIVNKPAQERNNAQKSNIDQCLSNALNSSLTMKDDIVSKSKLSADAKEWFPPEYQNVPTNNTPVASFSIQNRLLKYKTSEQQLSPTENTSLPDNKTDSFESFDFDKTAEDLQKVQDIITRVTDDPGEYDEILGTFCKIVTPNFEDVNFISNVVNLIVEQALYTPNFRYSAARLCLCLEEQCPLFRSALHLLCQKKTQEFPCSHGLALFLAELYAQLYYENLYGRYLLDCLRNLIQQRNTLTDSVVSPDNIKVVCQALKLTGSSLEAYNAPVIAEIFFQLSAVKDHLPDSVKSLVQYVITLKNTNWGQSNTNLSEPSVLPVKDGDSLPLDVNRWVSDPVFYGPDGKELTLEEKKFLAENCGYPDFMEDDSDDTEDWEFNPEMDEEVQIAFRQFLQQKN